MCSTTEGKTVWGKEGWEGSGSTFFKVVLLLSCLCHGHAASAPSDAYWLSGNTCRGALMTVLNGGTEN